MLELKNIKKIYAPGANEVCALKDVSLQFRESEFVSILGQSGCGKTTLLNIIGGLDKYTSGDLLINGKSTKHFKDRDWDTYRNHSVGFVFQSYNLIPHQTVLQNVELALTLSGVSKSERRRRAIEALCEVGLENQLRKKPAQMSGGQMQRVAIARALVNDPEIILADEPTGALDTETSVSVMEILKRVAKKRLVIMVTHNPELAKEYSTRIIHMLDGEILTDSSPLSEQEKEHLSVEKKEYFTKKRPSMSFFTAFGLSLKNLFTKKSRTLLTSFAGSIGIIGIALIYAVSHGMTNYINVLQEDTLSSYPLTLEQTTVDVNTLMNAFLSVSEKDDAEHELDAVYSQSVMFDMINALSNLETTTNDLASFKVFLEESLQNEESELYSSLSGVSYTYGLDLQVYTKDENGNIILSDTQKLLSEAIAGNMGMDMDAYSQMQSPMSSMMPSTSSVNLWTQMLSAKNGDFINPVLKNQYDVIYGSWPNDFDEIVIVVDENNEIDDLTLFALGLKPEQEMKEVFENVRRGENINTEQQKYSYEDIMNMDFRVVLSSDIYSYDEAEDIYVDLRKTDSGMRYLYDNALKLRVSGIIRPSETATSAMLTGNIGYTSALAEYVAQKAKDAPSVLYQLDNPTKDIFTNLLFEESARDLTDEEKEAQLRYHIASLNEASAAKMYIEIMSIPSPEILEMAVTNTLAGMTRKDMETTLVSAYSTQAGMDASQIEGYISSMSDEEITDIFSKIIEEQVRENTAKEAKTRLSALSDTELSIALTSTVNSYTTEQCAALYDEIMEFSQSTYESNLKKLGYVDLSSPATINLYASSFENKDIIEEAIASYNEGTDELSQLRYTDYVGIMMSSITTIINAITYVLIAFVAISLIVSSIMIGVITLISVQERTKEIGILRSIGASKKDVSSMFNAETVIIGFASGLLGIILTHILCIPINAIIRALTGIENLTAFLPASVSVILIFISVLLTLFAGIIPSRSAAKKDPVVALRTE